MTNASDYPYIRQWGHLTAIHDSYVQQRLVQARHDHAPADAVYRSNDGTWVTTGDISSASVRRHLELEPLPVRQPELGVIAAELRQAILLTDRFRDEFGLTDITIDIDAAVLVIHFSTRWRCQLNLQLRSPGAPG